MRSTESSNWPPLSGVRTVKVTVLGSGTVDPQPQRAGSGFYIEGSGGAFVMDLGPGTLRSGLLAGLPMATVQTLVLTHFHPDHTSDIVPFFFARKYAPDPWPAAPPMEVFGPAGTEDFLDRIFHAWPSLKPEADQLQIIELSPGNPPRKIAQTFTVEAFPAQHGEMNAHCYRFVDGEKTVSFSGDTSLCDGVFEAAHASDLFFCECSCFPRGIEPISCRQVHLSWEDVAEICQRSGAKKVVLTHLYELVLARDPGPLESLESVLSIPVELAGDRAVYQV